MSKHTPGPWSVESFGDTEVVYGAYEEKGRGGRRHVANVTRYPNEPNVPTRLSMANAQLIAAAPEMAEALQLALKYVDHHDNRTLIRAALKKAGVL